MTTSPTERAAEERQAKDDKLAPFRAETKMSKADRERLIRQRFPSVGSVNWENAFHNDVDLFARIMRDIIKLDQREPGKSGPRPNNMDYEKGVASFRQLMGEDYSTLPFDEAFTLMARDYSVRQLARKVNLSRMKVHRLLSAQDEPTDYEMSLIAEGFNKHPSFFAEYRRSFIVQQLTSRLLDAPEITITWYTKILRAG